MVLVVSCYVLLIFLIIVMQNNLVEASEYDFGEESDLFKAPEPIIEEPMLAVDPLSQELVELGDLGSLQSDQQLIDKAFYDCEQDLLVKSAMESPLSEVLDIKNISLVAKMDNDVKSTSVVVSDVPIPKSVSSGNLSSMDMVEHKDAVIQGFPDFPPVDYGMRRAFSESDIQVRTEIIDITLVIIELNLYKGLQEFRLCSFLSHHRYFRESCDISQTQMNIYRYDVGKSSHVYVHHL